MIRKTIPTVHEAIEGQQQLTIEKLMQVVEEGDTLHYKELAEGLLENNDSVTLLSAALKLLTKEPDTTPVKLTEEAPPRQRKPGGQDRREQWGTRQKRDNNFKGNKSFNKRKKPSNKFS